MEIVDKIDKSLTDALKNKEQVHPEAPWREAPRRAALQRKDDGEEE